MKNTVDYTDEQVRADVSGWMEDNLEAFKKKSVLFIIGLICFAISVIIAAFGGTGWASIFLFGLIGCWGGPLAVKYWFSGF